MYDYLRRYAAMLQERQYERGFDSAIKSVSANIKRGEKAMNTALTNKTTVHRAMYLQGDDDFAGGWVDFVWGADWLYQTSKDDKGNPKLKVRTGMGISHIIDGRMRKDGMSYDEVVYFLTKRIPKAIAYGRLDGYRSSGNAQMIKIYHQKDMIQLKRTRGNNAWIITAFELWE